MSSKLEFLRRSNKLREQKFDYMKDLTAKKFLLMIKNTQEAPESKLLIWYSFHAMWKGYRNITKRRVNEYFVQNGIDICKEKLRMEVSMTNNRNTREQRNIRYSK